MPGQGRASAIRVQCRSESPALRTLLDSSSLEGLASLPVAAQQAGLILRSQDLKPTYGLGGWAVDLGRHSAQCTGQRAHFTVSKCSC